MTDQTTETARALLYRHGLPEDVIDGALCLHAQELAAVQREFADQEDAHLATTSAAVYVQGIRDGADRIDPTNDAALTAVLPATTNHDTDRRAVLREAADRAKVVALRLRLKHDYGAANGAYEVTAELRRVADETAATETEAHAPLNQWRVEILDADEWMPASRLHSDRAQAADQFRMASERRPLWSDGTQVQRRLVRETTTYTVEQPAAGARQDETATPPCVECGHPQTDHGEGEDPVTPGQCRTCPGDDARHDYRTAAGARQAETESCAHCNHPKGDHDGRADHRAKYPPRVAGEPWCHACNAPCDYAAGARQDGAQR